MKKRLLALLLVAFVLCTMAVSSFAITNPENGAPLITDYAFAGYAYPEYRSDTPSGRQLFYGYPCPQCGEFVTYIDLELPSDFSTRLNNARILNNYKMMSLVIGSYAFYNNGFDPSMFIMANAPLSNVCPPDNEHKYTYYMYDASENKIYLHYNLDFSPIYAKYYICLFDANMNTMSANVAYACESIANRFLNSGYDYGHIGTIDWCLKNFTSSPYDSALLQPLFTQKYDSGYTQGSFDGFNNGYSQGYTVGYDEGSALTYKQGFDAGVLHGQDMTKWTFLGLFDGMFQPLGGFLNNIFSLGIGDITIRSVVGLCGIIYVTMFIIKIVRG